jgi:hypothetical protein
LEKSRRRARSQASAGSEVGNCVSKPAKSFVTCRACGLVNRSTERFPTDFSGRSVVLLPQFPRHHECVRPNTALMRLRAFASWLCLAWRLRQPRRRLSSRLPRHSLFYRRSPLVAVTDNRVVVSDATQLVPTGSAPTVPTGSSRLIRPDVATVAQWLHTGGLR